MPTEPETTVIAEFNDAGSMCRVMSDKTLERETYPKIWKWVREASTGEIQFAKELRSTAADLAAAVKALEDLLEIAQDEPCRPAVVAAEAVIEKAKAAND